MPEVMSQPDVLKAGPAARREILRQMIIARGVDDEARQLAQMGRIDLWLSCRGQEAAQIAAAMALEDSTIVPSFREHAMALARGISPAELLSIWAGRSFGGWDPVAHRFFPYTLVLAAQCHSAIGYAVARRLQGREELVTICIGEGATSEGDASEALNLAAVERAPVLFLVFNNEWALSKPSGEQMAAPLTDRAHGFGIPAASVDGLEPEAVYSACTQAAQHVRGGHGPFLLELRVVRIFGHASSDDQSRYRTEKQIAAAERRDPLPPYQQRLLDEGIVDDAWLAELEAQVAATRDHMSKEFAA